MFSGLISECHPLWNEDILIYYLGDDDDEDEIKVIPIKKRNGDCCDKEELKTIRIIYAGAVRAEV